jgi:hypothetical protein
MPEEQAQLFATQGFCDDCEWDVFYDLKHFGVEDILVQIFQKP